jgi:hypothetical protein
LSLYRAICSSGNCLEKSCRDDDVLDRRGLANLAYWVTGTEGSNPSLSTIQSLDFRTSQRIDRNPRVCARFSIAGGPRGTPWSARICRIQQNLSGRDFARSVDHRLTFAKQSRQQSREMGRHRSRGYGSTCSAGDRFFCHSAKLFKFTRSCKPLESEMLLLSGYRDPEDCAAGGATRSVDQCEIVGGGR